MSRGNLARLTWAMNLALLFPGLAAAQAALRAEHVLTLPTDNPVATAALSADGRLAYAIRKGIELGERLVVSAEVHVQSLDGKNKKRLLRPERFRDPSDPRRPLSVSIERIAWSPDGSQLAVEIRAHEAPPAVFFFKSGGGEVKLPGGGNVVLGYGAAWLSDGASLATLVEAVPPRLLHRVRLVRMEAGRTIPLFRERTVAAVAWLPGTMLAALVERDKQFAEPPRLLLGDAASGEVRDLGPEPDYLGGLGATPDGQRFSYFAGQSTLRVRTRAGEVAAELTLPFSRYEWLQTGALLFLEPEMPGLATGWLSVWDPRTQATERLLADELIAEFWLSPDCRSVAVLTADEVLKVYRLVPANP
ncbi:MAG: hypothetical protein HY653_05085 [Acidobacteria bacterium]|nr:hypothetical protein [Acidobacteriota bacterium]